MKSYKESVEFLAKNKIDNEFGNLGPEHAAVVLSNMLKTTEEELLVFSGDFNGDVTNDKDFMRELDKYLRSPNKRFHLLLEHLPNDKSKALQKVINASDLNGQVQFKKAPPDFIEGLKEVFVDGQPYHFAVSDSRAYRIETDKDEYQAFCNFNDKDIASTLKAVFETHF